MREMIKKSLLRNSFIFKLSSSRALSVWKMSGRKTGVLKEQASGISRRKFVCGTLNVLAKCLRNFLTNIYILFAILADYLKL